MLSKQQTLASLVFGTLFVYLIYSYQNQQSIAYKSWNYHMIGNHLNLIKLQTIQTFPSLLNKKTKNLKKTTVSLRVTQTFLKTANNTVVLSTTSSNLKTSTETGNVINNTNNNYTNNDLIIKLMTNHGLGNLMFMYASALGIALTNKRTLRVHPFVKKMNSNFNLSSEWVDSAEPNIYSTLHHPKCCKYYEETGRLPNERLALYGYYQSWKYFHKYKDVILREFSFSDNINREKQSFLKKIKKLSANTTLIGVHIRQGDFKTKGHLGYSVASKQYIKHAIDYFKTKYNCTFLIATNGERDWIRKIFLTISNIYYHFINLSAYVDMAVLSSCEHVITSSGTFSWWIGYLSKGTVLYYKDFPKKGSWLQKSQFEDMNDYFLPEWIGLL